MTSSEQEAQTSARSAAEVRIDAALEGLSYTWAKPNDGMACIELEAHVLHDALERLRDQAAFEALTFITAIDHLGERPVATRFHVIHQLHSITEADRVRLRTPAPTTEDKVPSCVDLWPGAGFMERECWDMFGIEFEGNPNLSRLMMPEGYGHHPLRKDFPHQGIEPDRLYREWDRNRRADWDSGAAKER